MASSGLALLELTVGVEEWNSYQPLHLHALRVRGSWHGLLIPTAILQSHMEL